MNITKSFIPRTVLNIIFILAAVALIDIMLSTYKQHIIKEIRKNSQISVEIKHTNTAYIRELEPNKDNMLLVCKYYDIKHPKIVTAQALLESGNFKSKIFKSHNNPFGLYNSKGLGYFKFDHWTDAVLAYKIMIESKYKGEDYYAFLKNLPYALDSEYIHKVKAIESTL